MGPGGAEGWDGLGRVAPRTGGLLPVSSEASAALQVRATKDYCNNYDLTSLNVKAGDIITVRTVPGCCDGWEGLWHALNIILQQLGERAGQEASPAEVSL